MDSANPPVIFNINPSSGTAGCRTETDQGLTPWICFQLASILDTTGCGRGM